MTRSRSVHLSIALLLVIPTAIVLAGDAVPHRSDAQSRGESAAVVSIDSLFPLANTVTLRALPDDPGEYPSALTVTRDRVVITDARQALVRLFDRRSGARIHSFGRPGDGPGDLRRPVGLQASSGGDTIFVLDSGRSIVAACDTTGKMIRELRLEGVWSDFVSMHNDGGMMVAGLRRGDIDTAGNIDEPAIVHEVFS